MAYQNKNFGGGFRGNQNRGQNFNAQNVSYGNSYNQNNNSQRPAKKHSGCKEGVTNGNKWMRAWNFSKQRGLITVLIARYHGTKVVNNKEGEESTLLMASVFFHRTGQTQTWPCLLKHNTGKVTIDQLGMVANPKAPNGGYFGTFTK